jgi:SP family general alpha glucoside:H+ symporter-like MFS transporter
MASYILITGLIFIPFFARSLGVLVAGEILCGLVWGQFSITAATYASEVCPLALRAYLTSYINITWIIGQFLAACVLRGVSGMTSQWAYKIPFAVQWVWPVPLLIGVYFAPESPWWLVRKGQLDKAEVSLKRLAHGVDPRKTVAMMVHTDQLEQEYESGTTDLDCFRGVDRRRTEIACMAWAIQVFFGLPMVSSVPPSGYNQLVSHTKFADRET